MGIIFVFAENALSKHGDGRWEESNCQKAFGTYGTGHASYIQYDRRVFRGIRQSDLGENNVYGMSTK